MNFFRHSFVLVVLGLVFFFVSAPVAARAPALALVSVAPNQAYNHQPTTITITGSGFVATPTVVLNNAKLMDVVFVNSTTLTATVPANLPAGVYTLNVINPDLQNANLPNAFTVWLGGDGSIGAWQYTSSTTVPRCGISAVTARGNVYALGGNSSPPLNSVERAVINPDGTLGTWQTTSAMNTGRWILASVVADNFVYALGGSDGSNNLNSVEYAPINPDGTLGTWQNTSTMNTARSGFAAVATGGYVYALGGSISFSTNTVERAAINPDGTLGTWEFVNSMIAPRTLFAAVAAGNYIYVLGGFYNSGTHWDSVERVSINADGTLGTWQTINAMTTARFSIAAVSVNGFVYTFGGDANYTALKSVERAIINLDGTLGTWQTLYTMNLARRDLGAVAGEGHVYAIGGFGNASPCLSTVEQTPLTMDTDTPTINSFSINGGALNTPSLNVTLPISVTDPSTSIADMSFSSDGNAWSSWQTFNHPAPWTITSGDGVKTIYARVRDRAWHPSNIVSDTIILDTTVAPEFGLTINDNALFTNQVTVTLKIGAQPGTAQMQVSNEGNFAGATWEAYTASRTWQVTQYLSYVIPRLVYVRFKDVPGNISSTFLDDVILDVTAPTGSVVITGTSFGIARRPRAVTLTLSATDDVSGVGTMMLSNRADFVGATWQAYSTSLSWTLDNNYTVYVRFKDNAGNISQTYSASQSLYNFYLPFITR